MNRVSRFSFLLVLFVFFLHPAPVLSEKITIDSEDQFGFALQYMQKGKYQRAIIEFERFLYFFPKNERVPEIRYLIGECYLEGNVYESAREALLQVYREYSPRTIAGKALFMIGESYRRQGVTEEAEYYYQRVIDEFPDTELKSAAQYRIGWNRMQDYRWQGAAESFNRVERSSPLYSLSLELSERSLEGEELPYKDPTTAGILAGILPGLGHVYNERYKDGMVSFLLNGLFIWAAYESFNEDLNVLGGILVFLELGWYSGNIYSAVNAAHKHNRKLKEDYLRDLPDYSDLQHIGSRRDNIGLALKFDF